MFPEKKLRLLNLGCGGRFHPDWVNVDFNAHSPGVIAHDLRKKLPFDDAGFDAVYHSHVLEHFSRADAPIFLKECHRVLASDGILRVAVPDLETIARLYLKNLEDASTGNAQAGHRYEWMTIEMMDQMVREQSGGEMLNYWKQNPMPAEDFVVERMGHEVKQCLEQIRKNVAAVKPRPDSRDVAAFRETGEIHQWMYDRYSLKSILEKCGFRNMAVCAAHVSRIPNFNLFLLDLNEDGSVRKPDSLFMEAQKEC